MTHGRLGRSLMPIVGMLMACLACGSGSSGFRGRDAELAAILSSAETGTCQTGPGRLEVCAKPAGTGEGAICETQAPGCGFVLTVELADLEPGTMVIGAVEPQDLSLPWRTSANSLGPATGAGALRGDLSFATDITPGTVGLRAILIYPPGLQPPALGSDGIDADLLSDLGAPQQARVLVDWPIAAAQQSR